jgi:hypothetical protein
MSSEERRKILQMVEEGKISAADAAGLMRALDEDAVHAEAEPEAIPPASSPGYERTEAPEFDQIKARARRFSSIPLWTGIGITLLSAWIIYVIQQNVGANFWFYCMILPLMFGVLLIALGSGGRSSRWIYINVDRRKAEPGDGPQNITLGFPLPLGFVGWFFSTFGSNIQGVSRGQGKAIADMIEAARHTTEPLMINVDDDDAKVQVYIG